MDKDCITQLETHHEIFSRELDSLIELLSPPHPKGDNLQVPDGGEPSRVEERESEVDKRG